VCDEPSEINPSDGKVALLHYVVHAFYVWTNGYVSPMWQWQASVSAFNASENDCKNRTKLWW